MTDLSPQASAGPDHAAGRTLIDDLLARQQQLTAVDIFARAHDQNTIASSRYRNLIPLTAPARGQQYAFEVDLDKCFGCKACVGACHSLNGLDEHETWRSVGLLVGDAAADFRERRGTAAFQQNVTTACHHCVDPGCLNGCPVLAYDKDPVTGIVRHLDDQCIGCQYCVMKCPYEVPQYSKARGIVRKCDMCHSRLAVGEAPACVQACPSSAITIAIVEQAEIKTKYRAPDSPPGSFLAVAPDPAITLPATRFVSQRPRPENLFAGDHSAVRPADPHWPLVFLLVFSQLAVGASIGALLLPPVLPLMLVSLAAGLLALVAGSLHLGQPLKAWRCFLGWRASWFSREVIAFGGYVLVVALAVGSLWLPAFSRYSALLMIVAVLAGLSTVACSAMIYVDTRREFWNAVRTFPKFLGTLLITGAAAVLMTLAFANTAPPALVLPAALLGAATLTKFALERQIFAHLVDEETPAPTPLNRTARLLAGQLSRRVRLRIACGLAGGVLLPVAVLLCSAAGRPGMPGLALAALAFCVAGELLERHLFFTAVVTQKMPGGLAA